MVKPFAGRSFLGIFGLVFLAIAVLFVADTFLANAERAESLAGAARLFQQGQALMQRGDNAQAIERIQDALAIERGNRDYLRMLAQAQFAAGKTSDAESTLTELLQSNPTDGLASLVMGRVLVKEGRFAEAISYLHRAIYGDWKEDAAGNRLRARFELIDLLAGRIQVLFDTLPASIANIRAGKLRALAVTTKTRSEALPDVPAMNEFVPGYEATSFHGIAAPKGTPPEIIEKLNRAVNASLADPKVKSRLADLGGMVLTGTPTSFGQYMAGEIDKWGKVVKFSGAKQEN